MFASTIILTTISVIQSTIFAFKAYCVYKDVQVELPLDEITTGINNVSNVLNEYQSKYANSGSSARERKPDLNLSAREQEFDLNKKINLEIDNSNSDRLGS